jgi:CelD/BcsL family acetyltransferase involved in cellulose biosynthesis
VELRLYDHTAAATMRGLPVATATAAYRRAKRLIKQTPALWNAFSVARNFIGGLRKAP